MSDPTATSAPPRRTGLARFGGAIGFGAVYSAAVAVATACGGLLLRGAIDADMALLVGLFAIGALVGGTLSALAVDIFGRWLPRSARLALALLALILLTTGFQHVAYYLQYASYYWAFWPAPFSAGWYWPLIATYAGSGFYFTALGLPLMLPVGLPVVFTAAFLLSRRPH